MASEVRLPQAEFELREVNGYLSYCMIGGFIVIGLQIVNGLCRVGTPIITHLPLAMAPSSTGDFNAHAEGMYSLVLLVS